MLDLHQYRIRKLKSPICLCFAGLEGKLSKMMEKPSKEEVVELQQFAHLDKEVR